MIISFMLLNEMSRKSFIAIFVCFLISDCRGAISDERLCGDPICSEPVSYAKTLIRYVSDDGRILSFQQNVKATIFSKSAGSRKDLWGVEINGKRGYAPRDFLQEYQVLKGKLEYVVSTDESVSKEADKSDVPSLPTNDNLTLPLPSSEEVKEVNPTTETLGPFEVADGTTIYYNTEAPIEHLKIEATTTDSNIKPTVQSLPDLKTGDMNIPNPSSVLPQSQPDLKTGDTDTPNPSSVLPRSQLDLKTGDTDTLNPSLVLPQSQPDSKTGDIDTPNPSLVLPHSTTSSDANAEKDDSEGSTSEKIYKYLLSNFMTEEASGEASTDSAIPFQVDADKKSEEDSTPVDVFPSSQKVLIESTESNNSEEAPAQPDGSAAKHDGNPEHSDVPPINNIDVLEKKSMPNENTDIEDEDEEDNEEDEEDEDEDEEDLVESDEDMTDSDQGHLDSNPVQESGVENPDKDELSIENMSENQGSALENQPPNAEAKSQQYIPKPLEPELFVHSDVLNGSPDDGSKIENMQPELPSEILKSENISGNNLEASDNEENIQVSGDLKVENNNAPDVNQIHEFHTVIVDQTVVPNFDKTVELNGSPTLSPLSGTQNSAELLVESVLDQGTVIPPNTNADVSSNTIETNLEKSFSNLDIDNTVAQENISLDSLQEENTESVDKTSELVPHAVEVEKNTGDVFSDSSVDHNVINDTYNAGHVNIIDASSGKPLGETTESNPLATEEFDFSQDKAILTTSSPKDFSRTTNSYIDDLIEDSPLNSDADFPSVDIENNLDDSTKDNVGVPEEGFFSHLIGSWFGSYSSSSTNEDIDNSVDNGGSETEESARNSAWSSLHSYTKEAEDITGNHRPETPSSCLAESGINPDCDKVLLAGNVPRVASDNEAVLQQIITEQGANGASQMDAWDYAGSYGSYLGIITAVSAVVVILGHWFIEKMRCDSAYIKKINELERALLYAELESKNLKIDLEENQQRTVGAEDSEKVALLEEQLKTALENLTSLEEKSSSLEEKNANLQTSLDAATEAGLELNRMLSELLSANKGSESLIVSVNDLQQQLNSQQATINNMKGVLTTKEAESESLRNNITILQATISSLERELNQMTETLNEVLVDKATQENQFKCIKEDLDTKLKSKCENETEYLKDISNLRSSILRLESDACTQDMEIVLLQQCIRRLKESTSGDENQTFKDLHDVAKANALCQGLLKEKDKVVDELAGEKDARQLLEAHVKVVKNEVDTLRKAFEQSEKEKNEAITKHAVLADYFKDKESQLHKELGYRDALYMKTKGDASSVHEEVKALHEQLENYKSQIDTLKKEITDQERGLKSQILAFEKKSHENWLAARQAERKLQEAKLEAAQLRNRLTMVEKTACNLQNDKPPVPVANDRDPLDPTVGSSVSPQLYPVDMSDTPYVPRVQPVVSSPALHGHASPGLPRPRSMPLRKSPSDVTFTVDEARDPNSPFYGILNPAAPFDPYYGRPIQDRHNPDLYHLIPLVPCLQGSAPLILPPPPVLPNDRRPPPLGRMSSPPADRPSPPVLHHYMESPVRVRASPLDRCSPPRGHRYTPDRGRRGSPSPPRHHRTHSVERGQPPLGQERGRRRSLTPRSVYNHTPSPDHRRPYRRRSRSPAGRYSDSSPDSGAESSRYTGRYDYSPESSYRGRSRTPSPTGFRPISREPSNNQGSNRSSNQSYESDESNRRGGRL